MAVADSAMKKPSVQISKGQGEADTTVTHSMTRMYRMDCSSENAFMCRRPIR